MTVNEPDVNAGEGQPNTQDTVVLEPEVVEPVPADVSPTQEVIFVDAPVPPKRRGNRLAGVLLSLLATVILTVATAAAVLVIQYANGTAVSLDFFTNPTFYYPSVLFFVGMVLIVLIVNNAGWWTYIFTSLVVAAIVYFGTSALALVDEVARLTPSEASAAFFAGLTQPFTIVAALLAREAAIWTGAVLGRRGRKVRARNADAQAAYEREQAELASTGAPPA